MRMRSRPESRAGAVEPLGVCARSAPSIGVKPSAANQRRLVTAIAASLRLSTRQNGYGSVWLSPVSCTCHSSIIW
jgi:hypothetical protein